ncbi:hypothetical protein D9Q98_003777 [Chlorella vulgaris]|uniref:ENTH domain-containing protein n=1 Tax=Chlorella vulgaris TaxID=3077 RepID=A0A9D4TQS4_CHLVU|nr:hypothetical protein D9Q98_003777 [Chlorella vulgaris]
MASKTSQAGSLAATFTEKLKVVGAQTSGDQKELNVAVIKATTSQFHVVPKEKHVRTLKLAVHSSRPRRDVVHIITELHRRLQDATDWLTALKTLITLHRLMRETGPTFMEELVKYSESLAHTSHGGAGGVGSAPTRLFSTDNFVDRGGGKGEGRFDFSEWVRAYGRYLDEQLKVFSALRWYVEQDAPGTESRLRSLPPRDLLFQLPHLQRLQRRLLDCVPRGAARHDPVVLFSLSLVVKESFKLYKAVSEGVINLADAFFEMERHDAAQGLEYYKEGMAASDALSGYYATIEQIDEIKRSMQLPKLSTPPSDFLQSMQAYLSEAPTPLPAQGEAAQPTRKGVPLRRGKLLSGSGKGGGPAAAAALSSIAGPSDPGMVLPVPAPGTAATAAATAQEATSPSSTSNAESAQPSGGGGSQPEAASEAAAPPPPPSSALDLLSDLDFSFAAPTAAPATLSSNPFADISVPAAAPVHPPVTVHAVQPSGQPLFMQPSGSSNPFGDPSPGAGSGGGGAAFDWPGSAAAAAAPPPQTQQWQQPAWAPAAPAVPQQQQLPHQQQQGPHGSAALASPTLRVSSDDPFVGFGAPSPPPRVPGYGAAPPSPGAGYWGSPSPSSAVAAAPYGAGSRTAGDELSKAALTDPFAALSGLSGLPPKNSPSGSSGSKMSPPRPAYH